MSDDEKKNERTTRINLSYDKINQKMLSRKQIKKIEDIIITKEELEKSNEYFKMHNRNWIDGSDFTHYLKRVTNIQGVCCLCDSLPSKLVTFRSGLIERYCQKCIHKIKDDLSTDNIQEKVIIKHR